MNDRIGLLLCGGFQGTTVTKQARDLIVEQKVSTMILLKKNAESVVQILKLIQDLQYIAFTEGGYKYPLAFAIDEEGGMLNTLFDVEYLSQFPGAMAMAASGDVKLVYDVLKALALQLRHIGFSIILGPVLDVVTKFSHQLVSVRSFGTSVDGVVKFGRACAQGLRDGGLLTVGKHFPGIGSARVNSLLELPYMDESLDQIQRFNLAPFAELIKEGLLDGISAAGCAVPSIAPDETHACLLRLLLTQFLREQLHFDGFVISECLEMDALYHSIGLGQGVILALDAGCDLVMVCHDYKLQVTAIESIRAALADGIIEKSTLEASLARIERVQQQLPSWNQIFPNNSKPELQPFRDLFPLTWSEHQKLSEEAYRSCITIVRDYEGVLPLTHNLDKEEPSNILLLTPLLRPLYPEHDAKSDAEDSQYPGEEVFQQFGHLLADYCKDHNDKCNVLHCTYTANMLSPLHELLIQKSKAVIVVTSEALRNGYQVGLVKYVSVLCGASPLSLSESKRSLLLAKPLIIVATLSPYDFYYTKGIGSAYLCCYEYTNQALKELAGAIMGKLLPQGCIPGEKKFGQGKMKRRYADEAAPSPDKFPLKLKKVIAPKRRWLVDALDLSRDWRLLIWLFVKNMAIPNEEFYFASLGQLLHSNASTQKHFVVRNSSTNVLYGVVMTWVYENYDSEHAQLLKVGSLLVLMVEQSKRHQLIGRNLINRAMRYLTSEAGCKTIQLGGSFPLLTFSEDFNNVSQMAAFYNSCGWAVNKKTQLAPQKVLILRDLNNWSVPPKILRELTMVGVRFDICLHKETIFPHLKDCDEPTQRVYNEAISCLDLPAAYEAKIIIALDHAQNVVGSVIIFNSSSLMARYYPFIKDEERDKVALVGGLFAPVIDASYTSLSNILRFGLISSGITYLRTNFNSTANNTKMNQCIIIDRPGEETEAMNIGFEPWKTFHEYYDKLSEVYTPTSDDTL